MSLAPNPKNRKIAIAAAIVGTLASIFAIQAMVGQPARLVDLVGLFAAAFTAGVSLFAAFRRSP